MGPVKRIAEKYSRYHFRIFDRTKRSLITGIDRLITFIISKSYVPHKNRDFSKILVIRNDGMGDFILSIPAMHTLRKHFPKAFITLIAGRWVQEIARETEIFNEIIPFGYGLQKYTEGGSETGHNFISLLKLVPVIRKRKFGLGIDMRGDFRLRLFLYLCGIPRRVSFDIGGFESLLTEIVRFDEDSLERTMFEKLISYICGGNTIKHSYFPYTPQELSQTLKQQVILVCPSSRWASKMWPIKHYRDVIEYLLAKFPDVYIKICVPSWEADRFNDLVFTNRTSFLFEASWKRLMLLIKRTVLVITSDGPFVHIADAAGTPVVALFGPVDPQRFGSTNPRSINLRGINKTCLDCKYTICNHPEISCMDRISVQQVISSCLKVIGVR